MDFEACTATHEAEIPLTGGCLTADVVRVGATVRRPSKSSSQFVAQLLAHLEAHNVSWAPRYLGRDESGRDTLTYVHGWVPQKWRHFTDQQVQAAAQLLRDLHDATRASELAASSSVVCHHDPGPNNFVFEGDLPIALIDFDMAAPGEPIEDIGYMAWAWCISSRLDRQPAYDQARQVRVLVDAYGLDVAVRTGVVDAILDRQSRNIRFWSERLASDEVIPTTHKKMLERIEWSKHELAYTIENREQFAAALC